jgi:hypothetical protein
MPGVQQHGHGGYRCPVQAQGAVHHHRSGVGGCRDLDNKVVQRADGVGQLPVRPWPVQQADELRSVTRHTLDKRAQIDRRSLPSWGDVPRSARR